MKRRSFITLLGGAAAVWPVVAGAQRPAMPTIGIVHPGVPEAIAGFMVEFRKGLGETGFVEGRNVAIEYRFAYNDNNRVPELVADVLARRVAVIAAPGGMNVAAAAKALTTTTPVVFSSGGDPVQLGLVASLNRPGGNITGVTGMGTELTAKRLGLLHALLPDATRFGLLLNPTAITGPSLIDLQAAASSIGRQVEAVYASTNREIDAAFATLVQKRIEGLVIGTSNLFGNRRVQIVSLAAHHSIPVIYSGRQDAEAGGLMSYGASSAFEARQVGIYTGRILRGEKPSDLPIMQPTKFELIINLQTARLLSLDLPATLLATADEVIE